MATSLVPRVVSRFLERQPGALVRLLTRNSQVVHDLQEWQALDLGFAELPGQRGATMIDSFELDCVCVLPQSTRWPIRRSSVRGISTGFPSWHCIAST
jgi:DNA-binding transcriptional LysR family regulator